MSDPSRPPPGGANELEREFARPLTRPETEEGIGPTLGGDASVEHQRDEDRRHGAHDIPDDEETD